MARRCLFSFDYENVTDFRVNVVRNFNALRQGNGGVIDASIWEDFKTTDPVKLKRLIDDALERTTVTAVLIGTGTHARRWVRYEIMKSLERSNLVIGIHVNGIRDRFGKAPALGPNPFDDLGLQISDDGRTAYPIVWNGRAWVSYDDADEMDLGRHPQEEWGKSFQLSHWLTTYDWIADDGYNNFHAWVD